MSQQTEETLESVLAAVHIEPWTEDSPDRRSSPRQAFRYRQRIAPRRDSCMPMPRDFIEVDCEDISTSGIAFYFHETPDFENLVITLGTGENVTHFTARVARIVECRHKGRPAFLVGCRFIGRVHM